MAWYKKSPAVADRSADQAAAAKRSSVRKRPTSRGWTGRGGGEMRVGRLKADVLIKGERSQGCDIEGVLVFGEFVVHG